MPTRRRVLLGGLALATVGSVAKGAATPLPIPPGNRLAFDVVRKDCKIGTHVLTFETQGAALQVRIAVDLAIGLGPITLFRYKHRAVETWNNGLVQSVDAKTDHDGYGHTLSMTRRPDGLWVEGDKGNYLAPLDTLPASHWNRDMLHRPMLNTETGALMHPLVTDRGVEQIATSMGPPVRAHHFSFSGDVSLETWYDDTPCWVGLGFTGGDGSTIRYQLAAR